MPLIGVWLDEQNMALLEEIRATLYPHENRPALFDDLGVTASSILGAVMSDEHAIIVRGHSRLARLRRREVDG